MATGDLILNIPFNETSGTVAADLAPGAHNAQLTAGQFVTGLIGKAAYFSQNGRAEIIPPVIPVAGTYTFSCWIRAEQTVTGPTATWLLIKFAGADNYLYLNLFSTLTSWGYVVLVQDIDRVSLYLNGRQTAMEKFPDGWGKPTGWCLVNDSPNYSGFDTLVDLRIYQGVIDRIKPSIQIQSLLRTPVMYSINALAFIGFGVYVSDSFGLLDNLNLKDPLTVDWDDYHGEVIDLSAPRYQPRDITLNCFIEGVGQTEFIDRLRLFMAQFQRSGTQRLMLEVHTDKPLVYEVYCPGGINLKKSWSEKQMIGTFELKLREPDPIKRVLKFGGGTVSITLTSAKLLTIYWGDGSRTANVFGTAVTITHTYTDAAIHYIVMAGVIEDITGFSSTAAIVWSRL